jgi:hypothetical protein
LDDVVNPAPIFASDPIFKTIFDQILSITSPLPNRLVLNADHNLPGQAAFTENITIWMKNTLLALVSPQAITKGDLPGEKVFQMVRSLHYSFSLSPSLDDPGQVFRLAFNAFGAMAIDRYCKLVLQKIISSLLSELSNASPGRRQVAISLAELLQAWSEHCDIITPSALVVRGLSSNIPIVLSYTTCR